MLICGFGEKWFLDFSSDGFSVRNDGIGDHYLALTESTKIVNANFDVQLTRTRQDYLSCLFNIYLQQRVRF
jgi:hypothetical protein